jgi:sugar O-acyltransferase (sialic acid O-acetyltransferase NeuD family)
VTLLCQDFSAQKGSYNLEKLLIIGAGSVGGFIVNNMELFNNKFEIIGILDDDHTKLSTNFFGQNVIGSVSALKKFEFKNISLVVGIAFPEVKTKLFSNIEVSAFNFPSFISKNSWFSKNVKIGKGVIIYPGVSINYNSVIDDFAVINMNCAIGHDCLISKFCALAPGSNLAGHTKLMEGVDFGIGASTKQNVKIGEYSRIGGNSIVTSNIPSYSTVIGIPGKCVEKK